MSSRSIRLLITAGSLLVVLVGGYTGFWYHSVSGIEKGLERWALEGLCDYECSVASAWSAELVGLESGCRKV